MANPNHDGTATDNDFFYDVFLSFRGEGGTRYGFTDHLYKALRQKGIYTFRDNEEVKIGEELKSALPKAIDNSRMLIPVLCQNYATSTWCLDELAKIVDCYDKGKQVLVIFYKVEPCDVWDLKNSYKKAMIEHEERFGRDSDKVKAWTRALSRVRHLTAEHCLDNRSEPELIKKIVKDTSAKLPPIPLPIKYIVGLESLFQEAKPLIDIESHDTVRILEIYGAGGIGKTTFALEMFNKMRHEFEASSFLANIREKSNKSTKGLEDLQKTLLSEMGEDTETMMGSIFQGSVEIKRRLSNKRVLLVLDDVDAVKQLESLAGGGDWFGPGSRIIVTTRDADMLDKHVILDIVTEKYKIEELNERDSLELFCWHAFNKSKPVENFEEVSNRAVRYAKGVPLALEVIGCNLKGGSLDDWEMELNKYKKIPNAEIQGVLEVSYNSLNELDQKTFLDIACFFKGERWEYVERILNACDFSPSIRVFIVKSLITVGDNGCLDMHDLIQGMGREVVRKESPLNVGDRSRLWSYKEVLQVLKENLGSSRIEGIMLDPPSHEEVEIWTNTVFENMKNLRILIIRDTFFSTAPSYLPNNVRVLDWKSYPSKSFPPNFYPQRIVDFKLPHSHLMLEKPFQIFEDLTFINLSNCQSMTQIPDLSRVTNLKVLELENCHKLIRFDKSIGFMPNLKYLNTSRCSMLKSFVPRMYLPSLEVLSFNFCGNFERFPDVMQKMDKPLKIQLIETAIMEFPNSVCNLTGLEYVDMSRCTRLKNLPSNFLLLPKLATLTIDGCDQLGGSFRSFKESLPAANGCANLITLNLNANEANLSDDDLRAILEIFPKLEGLNVLYNNFASLPECIEESLYLKRLNVSYCRYLTRIPRLPLSAEKIDARYCTSLFSVPSSLEPLWSKVLREERIQFVMPKMEGIPKWFDCVNDNKDIPFIWARRRFPIFALALMFGEYENISILDTRYSAISAKMGLDESHIVGLHLFIDGQEICRKDYHYCSVGKHHLLLCDLRLLFNKEEWENLDAACLGDDWKAIHVQCESDLILNCWGIYVYREKTNLDDIRFRLPHPNSSSGDYVPSSLNLLPKSTRGRYEQKRRHLCENFTPRETESQYWPLGESSEKFSTSAMYLRSLAYIVADVKGKASPCDYGTSLKREHEESSLDVLQSVDLIKENVPKHIADHDDWIQYLFGAAERTYQAYENKIREEGRYWDDIDMPIILEACHFDDEATSRRYWGRLVIKRDHPTFKAILRKRGQLSRRITLESIGNDRWLETAVNVVLLKSHRPSTEEASSSSHGDLELELELEELISMIETDAMSLNESYGKLEASIVPVSGEELGSDKCMAEFFFLRGKENLLQGKLGSAALDIGMSLLEMFNLGMYPCGLLGFNFKKTPYGKMRVGSFAQHNSLKFFINVLLSFFERVFWLLFHCFVFFADLFLRNIILICGNIFILILYKWVQS